MTSQTSTALKSASESSKNSPLTIAYKADQCKTLIARLMQPEPIKKKPARINYVVKDLPLY